ncbi:adenylate/guanylate cyclase domain-containing protein [Leptospira sp. GIMC2001]|uniref:adenylate/guanylate cyclase domain-containing protein n=1 Tax=Leptospira sp. GIMC2001 TaxID=1513297 RepID=UPI00234A9570|nr:adenylate/guanylate cyclase domain-containing protein [Leptospira sp. GIMC2001]WCL48977.1 adenylate/guanylate cyclase domain-containing protein [Leptospira sp. GIMC2001]
MKYKNVLLTNLPSLVVLLSNLFSVVLNQVLFHFIVRNEESAVFDSFQNQYFLYLLIPAFIVPLVLFQIYLYPITKNFIDGKEFSTSLKKKVLNIPMLGSLIGCVGWVMGSVTGSIIMEVLQIPLSNGTRIAFVFVSFCNTVYAFSLSYFTSDYFCKRYLFPKIFGIDEIFHILKFTRSGLVTRFGFYFFSVTIFPLVVIFFVFLSISSEDLEQNNIIYLFSLMLTFLVSGLILSFFILQSFRRPLDEIRDFAQSVRKGDYDRTIFVDSTDEIGSVKHTLNSTNRELRDKEKMRELFGRMVDKRVRDHLLNNPIELGGIKTNVAVMFTDIRNFTKLTETMEPDSVVSFLNKYFEVMNNCIEKENGVLNKFIGDGILAFFGGIIPMENPAEAALSCAKNMIESLSDLETSDTNIKIGIGLHKGDVIAGNVGSTNRMEFTVIGSAVNLASRLETLTKALGSPIAMSLDFVQSLQHSGYDSKGHHSIKGIAEKIEVFTPR